MIDWTKMRAPEDVRAEEHLARRAACQEACRQRILAMANETTQLNLIGAAAAGAFSADELVTYRAAVAWIGQMRAAWKDIADAKADPADDALWPPVPAGVAELARRF